MTSTSSSDSLRLERQLCLTLTVAARTVVSLYRPLLEPLGLTHGQYLVMVALWESDDALPVSQLSRLLTQEESTLSPLLEHLEADGLVKRREDADDAGTLVGLTPAGDALRVRAAAVQPAILERVGMSSGELRSLRDALTRVVEETAAAEAQSS
ncbi:DNA-binding transcriptional regulator, MarR family [Microlunatus sagamiharensis]|uniref:DNA-binding transcriptional regulator, MarR family n=1 Tax=Microlunatus sagamiharensis TaxID=546874 RepID=A0A1H2LJ75_9ACTN|nr:MarR family transcriptional regulator [Microlunatus sagamiharensis]SDU81083.1 DNA-binding transcriptional regulator, MarR family [Microlunatus sagamiharensis]